MSQITLRAARAFLGFLFLVVISGFVLLLSPNPSFIFTESIPAIPRPNPSDLHIEFDPLSEPASPIRYDLTITPDLTSSLFHGNATITFFTAVPVSSVWLHLSSEISLLPGPYSVTYFPPTDDVRVDLRQNQTGLFAVVFTYTSALSVDNHGFYGTTDPISGVVGAATQFEPTHARRVFPCHDSPGCRAVFSLSLYCEAGSIALSNMPAKRIDSVGSGRMYHFHETPPMPAYLLAFAVGKWDLVSSFTERNVPVDVYTPPGQAEYGEFALKIAVESITYFEDYFGIDFPLPRLQLASIPDFAAGAMENWGFVTFRDLALLAREGTSSLAALARVAEVVVHENTHMWCGDLVSPRTWGHLWLNEAFATLMPYLCLAEIAPEYVGENDLARFEVQEAIEFDFSRYTHPIAADPNDPHAIFDSVSYSKGAAVLGMLAQGLGERPFQYGMRMYFEEYNLGTSTTDEFLESFDRSIGEDISEFIRPWITQAGFPTIQVSRSGVGYHLRQTRLCRDGAEEETLWPIPVSLSTGGVMVMDRKEMDIRSDDLITINDGRLAMAIIEYEQELLGEIIQNWKEIEPEARWVLLDDLWELMLAKRVSPRFLWDALNCLRYETSLEVVETGILRGIQFYQIYSRVNRSLSDIFRPYVIMDPPQSLFASRFRVKLLSALIRMEDQETLESVRRISIDEAPEDLLPLVMQLRGRTDFAFAKAEYAKAQTPQRRNAALAAIGATETHLSEAFAMILKDIKTHEIPTLLAALGANRRARGLIVEWFKTNADKLFDIFTAGSQMQSIITIVYGACDSASEVEGLSNFFTGDRWSPLVATIGRASEYESARMHLKTIPWDTQ